MQTTRTRTLSALVPLMALFATIAIASMAFAPAAHADTLVAAQDAVAGASADASASNADASAASQNVKIYVLKSIGPMKYGYNKKGQLISEKGTDSGTKSTVAFKYKKNRIASFESTSQSRYASSASSGTVTYNAKGQLKKISCKGSSPYNLKYAYNDAGQVTKESGKRSGSKVLQTFTYNSKGRMLTAASANRTDTMKYDSKGNIKSVTTKFGRFDLFQGYQYTYKDGRATTRGIKYTKEGNTYYSVNIKYKQITVPQKFAAQVKAQQYALMNPSVSFSIPRYF